MAGSKRMKTPVGDVARVVPQIASADINTIRLDAETSSPGQFTGPSAPMPPKDFQASAAKYLITTSSRGSISQARPIRHQTTKELPVVRVPPSCQHSNSCSGYSSTGVHRYAEGDAGRWAQYLWGSTDEGSGQSGSPASESATATQRARVQALVEHVRAASEGPLQLPELKRYLPPGHPLRDITSSSRDSMGGEAGRASDAGTGGATNGGGGDLGGESAGGIDGLGPHYPFGPLEARPKEGSKSSTGVQHDDDGGGGGGGVRDGAVPGRADDGLGGLPVGERSDSGRILAAASGQMAGIIAKECEHGGGGNNESEPDYSYSVGPVAPRAKQAWARLEAAQGGPQPAVDAGSIGGGSSILFGAGSTAGSIVIPSSISRGITPGALASMEAFVRREREAEAEAEAAGESQGGYVEEESYGSEGGYNV